MKYNELNPSSENHLILSVKNKYPLYISIWLIFMWLSVLYIYIQYLSDINAPRQIDYCIYIYNKQ